MLEILVLLRDQAWEEEEEVLEEQPEEQTEVEVEETEVQEEATIMNLRRWGTLAMAEEAQ